MLFHILFSMTLFSCISNFLNSICSFRFFVYIYACRCHIVTLQLQIFSTCDVKFYLFCFCSRSGHTRNTLFLETAELLLLASDFPGISIFCTNQVSSIPNFFFTCMWQELIRLVLCEIISSIATGIFIKSAEMNAYLDHGGALWCKVIVWNMWSIWTVKFWM